MSALRTGIVPALLLALTAIAQGQEPRLAGRVPEPARTQVNTILAAARTGGLPTEPLIDRALEGAAKGAPAAMIVAAVTRLRDELVQARSAFGERASSAELTAGASALRAGATAASLARLRAVRSGKPLTVAAAVMADLVAAGVPADTAVGAVLALASDADDADYLTFRRNVQRDIALGASPSAALAVRIRAAVDEADAASSPPGTGQTGSGITRKRKP
jgi:hypothetical protein